MSVDPRRDAQNNEAEICLKEKANYLCLSFSPGEERLHLEAHPGHTGFFFREKAFRTGFRPTQLPRFVFLAAYQASPAQ